MGSSEQRYETPKRRTVFLLIGFALLVGIGAVTVLRPEVEDASSEDPAVEIEPSDAQGAAEPLQE